MVTSAMRSVMLATGALMALPGLVAALNDIPFEIRFSDQSTVFDWLPPLPMEAPSPKGLPSSTWNVTYSMPSWSTWRPGVSGEGTPAHTTSAASAQSIVRFVGTGIKIMGTADGGIAVELAAGGQSGHGPNDGGVLAALSGLPFGAYEAVLTRRGANGLVSITDAIVSTSLASDAPDFEHVNVTDITALRKDDSIDPAFATYDSEGTPSSALWNAVPTIDRLDTQYPNICSNQLLASVTFTVPPNSAFLELWGSTGFANGRFTVSMTPAPPYALPNKEQTSFNHWEVATTLMYFMSLDPSVQYTVTVKNVGGNNTCIHKARVYSSIGQTSGNPSIAGITSTAPGSDQLGTAANGSPTNEAVGASPTASGGSNVLGGTGSEGGNGNASDSGSDGSGSGGKKSNVGAIAGGVVGGLLALAAVVALIFFLRRRMKNKRRHVAFRDNSDRSRTQAMYKATSTSKGRDRPSSWVPFLTGSTVAAGSTLGTHPSREGHNNMEMIPGIFGASSDAITGWHSRHTSLQTFDSSSMTPPVGTCDSTLPMTPLVGEFGTPILPHDEVSKYTPTGRDEPYSSFAYGGSHTSIPSQSSLSLIRELPRTLPPNHSFATFSPTGMAGGAVGARLTSPSSDTVNSQAPLPPGWPSPPTSPPRPGPRPPPRKHARPGSMSPPTSPNPPSIGSMPLLGKPGTLFD